MSSAVLVYMFQSKMVLKVQNMQSLKKNILNLTDINYLHSCGFLRSACCLYLYCVLFIFINELHPNFHDMFSEKLFFGSLVFATFFTFRLFISFI